MKKIYLPIIALALWSCGGSNQEQTQEGDSTNGDEAKKVQAIQLANLDTTVSPCQDFYMYANGGWLKNNPIPASESRWGSFNELYDKNQQILKGILEETSKQENKKGSIEQLVADFYAAGMDSTSIEKAGFEPIKDDLARINAIADKKTLLNEMVRLKRMGVGGNFTFYVYIDEKNSEVNIPYFYQGGLGMPDRDYYLKNDEDKTKIKAQYQAYIQKSLILVGLDEAQAKKEAQAILDFETNIAKISKSRVELRNPVANYNKMTTEELAKLLPNMNAPVLLEGLGVAKAKEVVVGQPEFFKAYDQMFNTTSLDTWKSYLKWSLIRSAAPHLSHEFVKADFAFNQTALRGTKEMKPRWKRILADTDGSLGEPLGQLYVKKAFSPEAKAKMMELIDNLQYAFEIHINRLDWMSDKTKKEALTKLAAFKRKIGYPDKWKDYSKLEIGKESYWKNTTNTNAFAYNMMVDKLGKPVDKTEWFMSPPTVNAYYNPPVNEIVFPAGILQAPFFDPNADDAVNYGAIGAVIGHELTHGFDDQGRQYDAKGNLRDWWQAEDATKFKEKADQVVALYSSYEVLPSVNINGELTLGENIADLGGLAIAYTALQKALENKKVGLIDGLSPNQRFFIAWAQVWRTNATDEFLKQQVQTDSHSPAKFRVNVPVSNMPEFYQAFGCKEGDALKKTDEERIKVW